MTIREGEEVFVRAVVTAYPRTPGFVRVRIDHAGGASIPAVPVSSIAKGPSMHPDPPEHIMQFFAFDHLPPSLQAVSRPFCELATTVVETLPQNPERTVALRKLLEAKDAAVRAHLAKEPST